MKRKYGKNHLKGEKGEENGIFFVEKGINRNKIVKTARKMGVFFK